MEFLKYFWEESVALNPGAASVDESQRFARWDEATMASLFRGAGFAQVETAALEIPTDFADFEDYWKPFLGRSGPAPSYVASLILRSVSSCRSRLEQRLLAAGEPIGFEHEPGRRAVFRADPLPPN